MNTPALYYDCRTYLLAHCVFSHLNKMGRPCFLTNHLEARSNCSVLIWWESCFVVFFFKKKENKCEDNLLPWLLQSWRCRVTLFAVIPVNTHTHRETAGWWGGELRASEPTVFSYRPAPTSKQPRDSELRAYYGRCGEFIEEIQTCWHAGSATVLFIYSTLMRHGWSNLHGSYLKRAGVIYSFTGVLRIWLAVNLRRKYRCIYFQFLKK